MARLPRPQSASAPQAERTGERATAATTTLRAGLLTLLVATVAVWPYTGVILPGRWTVTTVMVVVTVVFAGLVTRSAVRRVPAGIRSPVVMVTQALAATAASTALLAPETALYAVIPTPSTLQSFAAALTQAGTEITEGAAPIPATEALAALLTPAFGLLAILIDQLIAHRQALATIAVSTIVGAIPMIATSRETSIAWFLAQCIVVLVLLRYAARRDRRSSPHASAGTATILGAGAIAAALVITPGLPVADVAIGSGRAVTVDASLRLGEDLRRPAPIDVLSVATTGNRAPYLRMATLTEFDGNVWSPDEGPQRRLSDGFGPPPWAEGVEAQSQVTSIRVLGVSGPLLPIPYAADTVEGLGDGWGAVLGNRTAMSNTRDIAGAEYTVTSFAPTPTLEQIRAAAVLDSSVPYDPSLPPVIAQTAQEITAEAETDYDRMVALQNWFRSEFTYSLDAPVEDGFDGTGAEAVARFLQEKTGYCIHFAGAFALMARSLDLEVRIVVGYLPGEPTGERRGDENVFTVSSDQLHSWPEVQFEQYGWIPFEPTATLGTPTAFAPESTAGSDGDSTETPTPTPSAAELPSAEPTSGADEDTGAVQSDGAPGAASSVPVGVILAGIIAVALIPAILRIVRRARRLRHAASGAAMPAWHEVLDTLTDLGIPASPSQSPRALAAHLIATRGVDAAQIAPLVEAVEQANYARTPARPSDLSSPVREIRAALLAGVDRRDRAAALLAPRSLFTPSRPA